MLPDSPVLLYTGWAVVIGILIGCSLFAANLIASTESESLRTTRRNEAFTFMICSQLVIAPIFGISMMFLFSNAF
ncbi:hypothetical protein [Luteolibacter luteus]|uniref:Uncharacterized protein n=1 Tax=Luteolibacter luteus TaxID=2728835 RepID=A0A858RKE3_9BACT|nr:hypothetical protein [Luteolibacter luteus]QJE96670.1 hypothetical protein HHL09_13045 [Luteolibacter luteus]